jgi:steroid delta-isomerase-like uncharacterized protein
MPSSAETMRRVLEEHVEAENVHDRDRVLATYARKDPVFEDVPSGQRYVGPRLSSTTTATSGRVSLASCAGSSAGHRRRQLRDQADAHRHAQGAYRGVPPIGKQLELKIIAHFVFDEDGCIKQETAYYDTLFFMRQLGLSLS